MADLAWSTPVSCVTVSMRGTRAAQRGHALCRLDRIFKHQLSELMFDDDCRRKLDFSSEPVRTHWPLLWPSTLILTPGTSRPIATAAPPALAGCQLSRRNKCQVSKKAGAYPGLLYFIYSQ